MGVLDFLSKQFVDVIDWVEEPGVLAWRFPLADREIQNGAALTVREGQTAAFFNEGAIADMFGAGMYTLETQTLPLLTALRNWDKAFKSPFKADVVFFSHKEQHGLKWGTAQPVTVRDAELGPLRIRAFGTYSFRLLDVPPFFSRLVGTLDRVTVRATANLAHACDPTARPSGCRVQFTAPKTFLMMELAWPTGSLRMARSSSAIRLNRPSSALLVT